MKKVFLSFVLCTFVTITYAQKVKKINTEVIAKEFCACTTKFTSGLHPILVIMIQDIFTKGEEVAEENFQKALKTLSEPEKKKVMESAEDELDYRGGKFNDCIVALEIKYGKLSEKQRKEMIAKLNKMKGCEFAKEFANIMDK